MTLILSLSSILALISSLPLASSPIFLGVWILLLGINTAAFLTISISPWIAMITMLIYISGINVLFAYFVASAPNHHLSSNNMHNASLMFFILISLTMTFSPPQISITFISIPLLSIPKLLFFPHVPTLLTLALILFLALIAVVKIASRNYGPLRPFSYVTTPP